MQVAVPAVRQRKTFAYDLNDTSLDPTVMATARLTEGATPTVGGAWGMARAHISNS